MTATPPAAPPATAAVGVLGPSFAVPFPFEPADWDAAGIIERDTMPTAPAAVADEDGRALTLALTLAATLTPPLPPPLGATTATDDIKDPDEFAA